ncbi:hypothetical protein NE237_018601 [Protea cynaroides]|uniref:Uncharacterized protein n=1 Tax=Protea cynaroides TaxID=273540 RepID=A0A9Q0KA74_9MAGN|nr:hypothetical protein NE237_018601 [Protea cynaroides]
MVVDQYRIEKKGLNLNEAWVDGVAIRALKPVNLGMTPSKDSHRCESSLFLSRPLVLGTIRLGSGSATKLLCEVGDQAGDYCSCCLQAELLSKGSIQGIAGIREEEERTS